LGVPNPELIRDAFEALTVLPRSAGKPVVMAKKCGSRVAVAQGVGVVLLVLTLLLFVAWTPNTTTVALVLAFQLALWLLIR
jgi:hypothetical protein